MSNLFPSANILREKYSKCMIENSVSRPTVEVMSNTVVEWLSDTHGDYNTVSEYANHDYIHTVPKERRKIQEMGSSFRIDKSIECLRSILQKE